MLQLENTSYRRITTACIVSTALVLVDARIAFAQSIELEGIRANPSLLMSDGVCRDLKLSDDQYDKVQAIANEYLHNWLKGREQIQNSRKGSPQGVSAFLELSRKEAAKNAALDYDLEARAWTELKGVLTNGQASRLKQIFTQQMGAEALMVPSVLATLKLTDPQAAELQEIRKQVKAEKSAHNRAAFAKGKIDPETIEESMNARKEIEVRAFTQMLKVFSPSQKKLWDEMVGPPCNFEELDAPVEVIKF